MPAPASNNGVNQASITYPGIDQVFSGYYALSHGISPGIIGIEMVPQAKPPLAQGDVNFLMDGKKIITLTDCRIDSASFTYNEAGLFWRVNLLDRRWRWATPVVSVRANIRGPSGIIVENTEMTPITLARQCLAALGETSSDVAALLPFNNSRPTIEWDVTPAAQALADLCDLFGCRIVLGSDNIIHICTTGQGEKLPQTNDILSYSQTPDPLESPDFLAIIGAPIRIQIDLPLEAVGRDLDGSIRPLRKLSYAPNKNAADGYGGFGTMSAIPWDYQVRPEVNVRANQYAAESVMSMYRVVEYPGQGDDFTFLAQFLAPYVERFMNVDVVDSNDPKWRTFRIDSMQQLVLEDRQIDQVMSPIPNPVPGGADLFDLTDRPAITYGLWWNERYQEGQYDGNSTAAFRYIGSENGIEVDLAKQWIAQQDAEDPVILQTYNSASSVLIPDVPFSIDSERKLVMFAAPVVQLDRTTYFYKPATLCLRCSFYLKDPDTHQLIRFGGRAATPQSAQNNLGTPVKDSKMPKTTRYVVCDEIGYTLRIYRQPTGLPGLSVYENMEASNDGLATSQVITQSVIRANAIFQEYLNKHSPETATYVGLKQIALDGAIELVTWEVGPDGSQTTAHRNNDLHPFLMSYGERRFVEKSKRGFLDLAQVLQKIQRQNQLAQFNSGRRPR